MPTMKEKEKLLTQVVDLLTDNGYDEITLFATNKDHNGILSTFRQTNADTATASVTMLIKLLSEELNMKSTDLAQDLKEALEKAEKKVAETLENTKSNIDFNQIF